MAHVNSYNKVVLVGHVGISPKLQHGKDPQINYCYFTLATNERFRNKQKHTDWHTVTCFGKIAELASQFLNPGSHVLIEGKLRTRYYNKDGKRHKSVEVQADTLTFLGKKEERELPEGEIPDDDEVPF